MSIHFSLIFKISLFLCIFAKTHFCVLPKTNFFELSKFIKFSQFSYFERNPIFCIQNLLFDV